MTTYRKASRRGRVKAAGAGVVLFLCAWSWHPAQAAECRQLTVAARICATAALQFADPTPADADTARALVDMRLRSATHGEVSITFIAQTRDQPLSTLATYRADYLDAMRTRGATPAELYAFRHRGAPAVAQQFTAIHPGAGAGLFWGVAIGVEVADGLVMGRIVSETAAGPDLRATWTQTALDSLYP